MKKTPEQRFWEKVDKRSPDECWNFYGYRNNITVKKKIMTSCRFSWILHFGKIPPNTVVHHKCKNKICVNPNHLYLKQKHPINTDKKNLQPINIRKGNFSKGESHFNAKLTDSDVSEIRKIYKDNLCTGKYISMNKLSKKYKVSLGTISAIIKNKTWKHIK